MKIVIASPRFAVAAYATSALAKNGLGCADMPAWAKPADIVR